jgi:hypothetical protein
MKTNKRIYYMAIVEIEGTQYKTTSELSEIVGVSYVTLWLWIANGKYKAPDRFNRRGWRLWNNEEIESLKEFANGLHSRNEN